MLGSWLPRLTRQVCHFLSVAKLARYRLQSSGHYCCSIAHAVFPVARTAATSTVITLSTGPTVAKQRCRILCCCVALTTRCSMKEAAGSKPMIAMAGISSIIATGASTHNHRASRRTIPTHDTASRPYTMFMQRLPSPPIPTHQNGTVNRSTTRDASTTWCDAQRSHLPFYNLANQANAARPHRYHSATPSQGEATHGAVLACRRRQRTCNYQKNSQRNFLVRPGWF